MPRSSSGLASSHYFCGGGGDTQGFAEAGFKPVFAANHDAASIETHAANFPDCEHMRADMQHVEMRKLPRTDVLFASPICTESSPAGGKRRAKRPGQNVEQLAAFDDAGGDVRHAPENFERTRVTALSITSAVDAHRFDVVAGENVVEFVVDWELFDWWASAFDILGYDFQLISVNAAHIGDLGNDSAPQWRDRIIYLASKRSIRMPKLEPRPLAYCTGCTTDVNAWQWWKNAKKRKVGKYREQYLYRCPNTKCAHQVVEPYVRPAASIIEWDNLGTRIGDRKRPLVPNTIARIRAGLDVMRGRQAVVTVNHGGDANSHRAFDPRQLPMPARTSKIGEGLVTPPFLVKQYGGYADPRRMAMPIDGPMGTVTANDSHSLITPGPFIIEYRNHATYSPVSDPLSTVTSQGNHHGLVIPYYTNGRASTTADPLSTVTTKDRHALVTGDAIAVEDCWFRMVQPREQFSSQRFPREYILRGTKTQQTSQAGNAVPVNVARWVGEHILAALDSRCGS